jgi:hypothetical protein
MVFLIVFILTIALTRLLTFIKDPNVIIWGYELHHFYYGIILLVIVNLFMIFGRSKASSTYLVFSAVAIAWIADEFLFILGGLANEDYFSTISGALVSAIIVVVFILSIRMIFRRKR